MSKPKSVAVYTIRGEFDLSSVTVPEVFTHLQETVEKLQELASATGWVTLYPAGPIKVE